MGADNRTISHRVSVAEQAFHVRIHPEEIAYYDRIAQYAETQLEELQGQGFATGQQLWAMAAFQIAIELFETRAELDKVQEEHERIRQLIERIEQVMPQ